MKRDQGAVSALYDRWVSDGAPPLGTSTRRWWDQKLVEFRSAMENDDRIRGVLVAVLQAFSRPYPGGPAVGSRLLLPAGLVDRWWRMAGSPGAVGGLTGPERGVLRYALELAEEKMRTEPDEFTDDDRAAVESLQRFVGETEDYLSPDGSS